MARSPSRSDRSRSRDRSAMSMSRSPVGARSPAAGREGRSSTPEGDSDCPFRIRLYVGKQHAPLSDYDAGRFLVEEEFSAYGWKHSTPTSILALIYPSLPPVYRSPQARFSWRHYYVDATPRSLYKYRDLVTFSGRDFLSSQGRPEGEENGRKMDLDTELDDTAPPRPSGRKVEDKTLSRYGYEVGDIISVSVSAPEPRAGGLGPGAVGAGNGVKSFGWGEGSGAGTNTPKDGRTHDHGWGARGGAPDARRGGFRGERGGGPREGRYGRDPRDAREGREADGVPGGSWRGGRGGGGMGGGGRAARSRSPGPRGDRLSRPDRSPVREPRDRRGDDRYDERRVERRESWSRR